jgi:hypothetical protein
MVLMPFFFGHNDVGNYQVCRILSLSFHAFLAIGCLADIKILGLQYFPNDHAKLIVIIHN